MSEAADPVTVALTGQLSFLLLLAAVLTWPVSLGLLRLYTRAVRRSMRTKAHTVPPGVAHVDVQGPGSTATLHDLPLSSIGAQAAVLFGGLMSRPRHAALVYTIAGCAYGVVMAAARLVSAGMEILPLRFLTLSWVFAWPVVLTVAIVATTSRRAKVALATVYFIGLFTLGGIAMQTSPDLTWTQVALLWTLSDLPSTAILLTYLSRRVRAVGPLVLVFMCSLAGSNVVLSVAGSDDSYLRSIVGVAGAVGLGGTGAFVATLGVGFVIFAGVGWVALFWIKRRYQAKQISDESITVDAIWLLFAVTHSIDLVFEHPLWILDRRGGIRRLQDVRATRILVAGWPGRRVGEGPDGPQALDRRMSERDVGPDRDRRFRVNDYFCYDDTWKMVLLRLVHESDAVLMDLRGFSRSNAGCVFEIQELARLVPLVRVVFIVDGRTDEQLLAETLGGCSAGVVRFGPRRGRPGRRRAG